MLNNLRMAALSLVGIPALLLFATLAAVLLGLYTAPGMLFIKQLQNTGYARSVESGYRKLTTLLSKV